MKRIVCMVLFIVLIFSAVMPAMAEECPYFAENNCHYYLQSDFSYPTCTDAGYIEWKCAYCNKVKYEKTGDAYGHDWELAGGKEASCTETGVNSYYCIECYDERNEYINALGHNYKVVSVTKEATCLEGGEETAKCSRCGHTTTYKTEKGDHVYGEWQISVEATDSAKGVRTSSCIYCGKEKTEEYYPDGTLYRGINDKEAVKVLQTQLVDCGFLKDSVDGVFGNNTELAVKAFQTESGITADGIAWPQTNRLLEEAWRTLMGLNGEASCCVRIQNEDGIVEFVYCADHQILMDAVDALFEEDITEEEYINTLILVRRMYQEELDMLYAEWLAACSEEEMTDIVGAQAMFIGYMNSHEVIWNKLYGADSAETLTKINVLLHDQWVELCGILDVVTAE